MPKTIAAYTHPNPRNPRGECECEAEHVGLEFYVTVKDGPRTGWLLGPFSTHSEALDNVERGNQLACDANSRAHWYAFGTAGVAIGSNARTVFGA